MSKFYSILKYTFKQNIGIIIISTVFSICICVIYKICFNTIKDNNSNSVEIGVIDKDQSMLSKDLCMYLQEQNINISDGDSEEYLEKRLINQGISAIVYIPHNYEHDALLKGEIPNLNFKTITKEGSGSIVISLINTYLQNIKLLIDDAEGDNIEFQQLLSRYSEERNLTSDSTTFETDSKDLAQKSLIVTLGFLPQLLMTISLFLAFNIVTERQTGIYSRISVTPVKFYHYILGTSLLSIVSNIFPVALMFYYIKVGKYDLGRDIMQIVPIGILFALFMVGVALLSGMCCNSQTAAFAVVVSVGSVGSIIGGCFFDIRLTPKLFKYISMCTPQYWMVQGLREVFTDVNTDTGTSIMALLVFDIAIFAAVIIRYNLRTKGNRILA